MRLFPLIIASVTAMIALGFVLWPLFGRKRMATWKSSIDDLDQLLQEREMLLTNLRDLDNDLQVQKVSSAEYESLRSELMMKAAQTYAALEKMEKEDPLLKKIEAETRV